VNKAKIQPRGAKEMVGRGHETEVFDTSITWGEMGEGEPLVLLHGIQDSHRTWRRVAPILALHFRVLMPDLPGHGYSGRPDAPYTLGYFADVVAEWMKKIGVPKAHVCGHSYGGGLAQWMLLQHRDCVDRMALVAAGGLGRRVGLGMQLATLPVLGRRLTPLALRHGLPLVLKRTTALFGHMEPEEVERTIRISQIPGTGRAFQRTVEGVINIFGQHVQTTHRVAEVGNGDQAHGLRRVRSLSTPRHARTLWPRPDRVSHRPLPADRPPIAPEPHRAPVRALPPLVMS